MSLDSKDLALTGVFASLYAVLSFIPLFPVIGAVGKSFTVALIIAPLVGLIIGPYRGALAASIGGFIAWSITQSGPFFSLSFVPGAATAMCSGVLYKDRWKAFAVLYSALLLAYGFYPTIGPMWLYPYYIWFHTLGLIVLTSQTMLKTFKTRSNHGFMLELSFKVGVISFIATLFGHVVGGILFEAIYFPTFLPNVDSWRTLWQNLIFIYPLERSIVVIVSVLIGPPVIKALRTHGWFIQY